MKTNRILIVAAFLSSIISIVDAQQTITAKQVQQKAIDVTRIDGTEAITTLTIFSKNGEQRLRKMTMVSKLYDKGMTEKKMVRFIEPADVKGTGFLTYDYNAQDDDKWIYMPALRKTRRIISSENAKSFMGSEFSYADMSMPTVEDFNYKFLPGETINGELCYVVEIIPKDSDIEEENGFSKKISYFNKSNYLLKKSIYYDLSGDKEKIMTVKSVIEVDKQNHRFRFQEIEMLNLLNNRKSISKTEQIQYNPNIPDDYFSTRYLEK